MSDIPVHELKDDLKFLEGYKRICELAVKHYDPDVFTHPKVWYEERVKGCDEMIAEINRRLLVYD